MKTNKIVYWICTGLISAMMLMSGIMYLSKAPQVLEALKTLGFPDYFRVLLGIAKIAGVVALLVPGFNTLKEWAYAGFTFVFIGALWTHISTDTSFTGALVALLLLAGSYWFHHKLLSAKEAVN
jgi:DoxX-like protein